MREFYNSEQDDDAVEIRSPDRPASYAPDYLLKQVLEGKEKEPLLRSVFVTEK